MARAAEQEKKGEYTIYVYETPQTGLKSGRWTRRDTHFTMLEAKRQAREIFRDGEYPKIEIKQKYFDKTRNKAVDVTRKTLERKKMRSIGPAMLISFLLFCGAFLFAASYFLIKLW